MFTLISLISPHRQAEENDSDLKIQRDGQLLFLI